MNTNTAFVNLGTHPTGAGFGALLALVAPAAMALQVPDLPPARVSIRMPYAQDSTLTLAPVKAQSADERLREVAATTFKELLATQSDLEPDIAAIVYGHRSALYSSQF